MRDLREIALEIEANWIPVRNEGALEALRHMKCMGQVSSSYGADSSGHAVVGTFLTHAVGWRGEVARRIKKELRIMCEHPRP